MQYTNFDHASDLVRQLRECENVLDALNAGDPTEPNNYIYVSAYTVGLSAGTQIFFINNDTVRQSLISILETQRTSLISELTAIDVNVEVIPPTGGDETPPEEPSSSTE